MRVSPIAHAGNLHVKVCGIHGIWALRMAALHVYCATLIQTLMVLKCAKHILQRPTHNESAARMSWSYHMLAEGDHNDACRDLRVRKPSEVTLQSHHTDPVYSTKSTSFYLWLLAASSQSVIVWTRSSLNDTLFVCAYHSLAGSIARIVLSPFDL